MSQEKFNALLAFFKVLADATRLRILGLLAGREFSVQELATTLELKEPTVSHHLARLKELGLVAMRAEGNVHHYRLQAEGLEEMVRQILTPEELARTVTEDLDMDRYSRKVLETFVVEGRLRDIPVQRRKRDVILRWLVSHFEWGRRYPEREVNEILKRFHWDSATLRREMIMTRLMARENSQYWRLEETPENENL